MNFDGEEVEEDERTAGVWREGYGGGGWRVAEVTLLIYDFLNFTNSGGPGSVGTDLGRVGEGVRVGGGGGGAIEKWGSRSFDLLLS